MDVYINIDLEKICARIIPMVPATPWGFLKSLSNFLDIIFLSFLVLASFIFSLLDLPLQTLLLIRLLFLLILVTAFVFFQLPLLFINNLRELASPPEKITCLINRRRMILLKLPVFLLGAIFIINTLVPRNTPKVVMGEEASSSAVLVPAGGDEDLSRKPSLTKKNFVAGEKIEAFIGKHNMGEITTKVTTAGGSEVNPLVVIEGDTLKIDPVGSLAPGKYHLKVTSSEGKILDADFTWGVLAINIDRSIELPGNDALLQFAVLNDKGYTICEAELELTIKSPSGKSFEFSTKDGSIVKEEKCYPNNLIDTPDYYAHFSVPNEIGAYSMTLTAHTENGARTVTDSFEVRKKVPYDISRTAPTRINPNYPYTVKLHITPEENWQGVVTETVPSGFDISPSDLGISYDSVETVSEEKIISWDLSLSAGKESTIGYSFDAPDESPEFYLLGPLALKAPSTKSQSPNNDQIPNSNDPNIVFQEVRSWQIASDATCNSTGNVNWNATGSWSCGVVPTTTSDVFILNGHTVTIDSAPNSVVSVTINNGGILSAGSSTLIIGNTANNGTSFTNNGTFTAGTGTVSFRSNVATVNILAGSFTSTNKLNNVTIVPAITTGKTVNGVVAADIGGNFSVGQASSSTDLLTFNMGGAMTITGTLTIDGGDSDSSVTFSSAGFALTTGKINLPTSGGVGVNTLTAGASVITLNGTSGDLFTNAGTFTEGTSTISVESTSGSPDVFSGAETVYILQINAASATLINAGANITTNNTAGNKLYVKAGIFNQEARAIAGGTNGTLQIDSGGTLCLGGTTGSTTANCVSGVAQTVAQVMPVFATYTFDDASTVIYLSDNNTAISNTPAYGNLKLQPKFVTTSYTYTLAGAMTIDGDFTINPDESGAGTPALTVNSGGLITVGPGKTTLISRTNSATSSLDVNPGTSYNLSTGFLNIATSGTLDATSASSTIYITGTTGTLFTRAGNFTITSGTPTVDFSGNGTATLNSGTITFYALTISGTGTKTAGADITVNNNLIVSAGGFDTGAVVTAVTGTSSITGTITFSSLTGTKTFTGNVTVNAGGVWSETAAEDVSFGGNLVNNATTWTGLGGIHNFTGASKTISGSTTTVMPVISIANGASVTNSGVLTVSTTLTTTSGTSTFINGDGSTGTLNFGGASIGVTTFTATAANNIVNYNRADIQTLANVTYYTLNLSGSGIKTMGGSTTAIGGDFGLSGTASATTAANLAVTGALSVGAGTSLTIGAFTFSVGTTTTVAATGSLIFSSATNPNKTFTGDVTVSGVWNEQAAITPTFAGNLVNNATTWTALSGIHNFTGSSKTISGSTVTVIPVISIANGASLTNSGTLTVSTTLTTTSGTSSFTNGDGATGTLNFGGASIGVTTFTATAANNTVNYNSASAEQTVRNVTYYNLSAITTSARTLKFTSSVTTTITNALTLTGTTGPTYLTLAPSITDTVWTIDPPPSNISVDYVSVSYSTATECISATNSFNGTNNTKWTYSGGSCNTAPGVPSALAQKKTTDAVLAVGDWNNNVSVKFTATASDTDNPDTLYLCVEKKPIASAFTGPEDACSSPGVAYSGTPVEVTVTIAGVTDTQYHWRARVKDAGGLYSAWVAYGDNPTGDGTTDGSPATLDYGIDTSDPTLGDIYDGTDVGVDTDFSTTSLSQLSANWANFDATVSGLDHYDYSIGTTQGGTDTKTWTDNSTTTSATATGLTLQTSQVYYFNVRAVDNAGNVQDPVISSDGQIVNPSLSFAVSPASINFANLGVGNSYSDSQPVTLTTSTNAYNGYVVRAYITDYPRSTDTLYTIPDFNGGSYATPDGWLVSDRGFGYTSSDTLVQGSNIFNSDPCPGGNDTSCYAPFSHTAPGEIIADHTSTVAGDPIAGEVFTITCKVVADDTKEAANYTTTIVYTITAQY